MYMLFFDSFASSYMVMCVDMLSYMFLCDLKPSTVSLNIPPVSVVCVPMTVRIYVRSLRMQFISSMGRWLAGLFGSLLFGLHMSFVALVHKFFWV